MTKQVGEHGLFCLDDTDYAAFALSMQCNAEAIDAALTGQTTEFEEFLERPYALASNATARVIFDDASGGSVGPNNVVGDQLSIATFENLVANGINPSAVDFTGYPRGFYLIGSSINWTVATPTNNTRRLLMVAGLDSDNGVVNVINTYTDLFQATDYEGGTSGGGALTVVGMLENDGNLQGVFSFFTHRNTGSTLNVAVGQWRVWAIYLGTGLVT